MIKSESWNSILKNEFEKDYFQELMSFIDHERKTHTVFPPEDEVYSALEATDYEDVKVVILGQDPYHGKGQAHGLSFSVKKGVKIPPSLRNIYKELNADLGLNIPDSGCLTKWSTQGVLLLNTVLTVRESQANSHKKKGWEIFTDEIIKLLNEREKPIVFILWGNNAISKKPLITNDRHLIIESVHPSPLSARRGFFGSKPFSKSNDFLRANGMIVIDWSIEEEQLSMF